MSDVFVSYSRRDSDFVQQLVKALQVKNLDNWIDHEDIEPSADWRDRIQSGIEEADSFLFVISPDSIESIECSNEIEIAIQNGKRFIPLVLRDVEPHHTHPEVARVNWIFFREGVDDFGQSFDRLVAAINTDLAWAKTHRRLQMRALEWERGDYDSSFFLRGKDLKDAEIQLQMLDPTKDPKPTDLQRRYILESRKDSRRRTTRNIAVAGVSLVILVLAVIAFYQRRVAVEERDLKATAQAQAELAQVEAEQQRDLKATAQAIAESERQAYYGQYLDHIGESDLALLISAQAYNFSQGARTVSALYNILESNNRLVAFLHLPQGMEVYEPPRLGLSEDESKLVIRVALEDADQYFSWDANSYVELDSAEFPFGTDVKIDGSKFSTSNGQAINWNLASYDGSFPGSDDFANRYNTVFTYWLPDGKTVAAITCKSLKLTMGLCIQPGGLLYKETRNFMEPETIPFDVLVLEMAYDQSQNLWLVGHADDTQLWYWDFAESSPSLVNDALPVHNFEPRVQPIALSPDVGLLAYIDNDNSLQIWNIDAAELLIDYHLDSPTYDIALSPDGNQLAILDESGIQIYELKGTNLRPTVQLDLPTPTDIYARGDLKFSGDGRILVFAQEKKILLWSVNGGDPLREINLLPSLHTIHKISVNQSGDLVAVGMFPIGAGPIPKLLLVDTPTSVEIGPFLEEVYFPALSPDGYTLVTTCDYCGRLKKWVLDADSWRDQACQIAGRNLNDTEWKQFMGSKLSEQTCPR